MTKILFKKDNEVTRQYISYILDFKELTDKKYLDCIDIIEVNPDKKKYRINGYFEYKNGTTKIFISGRLNTARWYILQKNSNYIKLIHFNNLKQFIGFTYAHELHHLIQHVNGVMLDENDSDDYAILFLSKYGMKPETKTINIKKGFIVPKIPKYEKDKTRNEI